MNKISIIIIISLIILLFVYNKESFRTIVLQSCKRVPTEIFCDYWNYTNECPSGYKCANLGVCRKDEDCATFPADLRCV